MLPAMIEGTRQWLDRHGEKFETLWWFAQGGGVGILEINDETELMRMLAEHPFTPYCEVELQACVDPPTGVDTFGQVVAERMAAMQTGGPGGGVPA
jgi:muconolactone delta-isomerase